MGEWRIQYGDSENITCLIEDVKDDEFKCILIKICKAFYKLYMEDGSLFSKNNGRGVAERCLVFRLAHYFQNCFKGYTVDCDYNSSFNNLSDRSGKQILNSDGSATGRFIDIIVHKRNSSPSSDYVCFEVKKWNNKTTDGMDKDVNNLKILTSVYSYKYGFHIILGKNIYNFVADIYDRHGNKSKLFYRCINEN